MKGFSRYFTRSAVTFLLIAVPALALAQEMVESNPLWDMFKNLTFIPPAEDMSVKFLAKMFGAVPGVPQLAAGGRTILGAIFGVFNAGILALSGVFLSYTITKILTETTMDGSAMGKSTTIWTSVRCALSTSLLVPQASGYSMINGIIMWVVVQSIGLADMTWGRAMDYLKEGAPLYAPPTAMIDYSLINHNVESRDGNINNSNHNSSVGSTDVLRSLTCAHAVHAALKKRQMGTREALRQEMEDRGGTLPRSKQIQWQNANKTIPEIGTGFAVYNDFGEKSGGKKIFQFPYVPNESESDKNPLKKLGLGMGNADIQGLKLNGMCGAISYDVDISHDKNASSEDKEKYRAYVDGKRQGLKDMITILNPVAKRLVREIKIPAEDNGKRTLDYKTAVLYTDSLGEDKYLLMNPNLSKNRSELLVPDNRTISGNDDGKTTGFLTNDGGGDFYERLRIKNSRDVDSAKLPAFNWIFGVDSILSAAAAYQVALAPALMTGIDLGKGERDEKFEEAKSQGWIAAGGYYRLLVNQDNEVEKTYKYYRLTGLDVTSKGTPPEGKPFAKPGDINNRGGVATGGLYDTLFGRAFEKNQNNSSETTIAFIEPNYDEVLKNSITWILLTYPYAKVRGEVVSPKLSGTATGVSYSAPSVGSMGKGGIIALTVVGCILLPIPLLQIGAIPILTMVPLWWLKYDVNKVFRKWDEVMGPQSADLDPILKLKKLGDQMLASSAAYLEQIQGLFVGMTISIGIASGAMQLSALVAAPFSIYGLSVGVSLALNTIITMMTSMMDLAQGIIFMHIPLAMAVIGPLFVSGIMFSIYLPLVPYLLFLFGAISWLISVLVLMAAAPIICFLMLWGNSSQENPLLAREAEQFVMQVIGVFFRPTLMIIGLIAGMVLSYISVDILNLGFFNFVDVIITPNDGAKLKLIKQIGIITVYTFTMMTVINMSFSTIYLLYSEAMRVAGISAPAVGMEAPQLEAVKGAGMRVAEAGVAGMKGRATALKGAAKARGAQIPAAKGKQKASGAKGEKEEGGSESSS